MTAEGQRALPGFTDAIGAIGSALQTLRAKAAPRTVHFATLPALAQLWLSSRPLALRATAPEITTSITAMQAPPNLQRAPCDLCLFFGYHGTLIAVDVNVPVFALLVAAWLRHPHDLHHIPGQTDDNWSLDWAIWADLAMPGQPCTRCGPVFSVQASAMSKAAGAAGAQIGHPALWWRPLWPAARWTGPCRGSNAARCPMPSPPPCACSPFTRCEPVRALTTSPGS